MIAIYNETTFERATQSKDLPIPDGWAKGRFYNVTPQELIERKKVLEEILKIDPKSKVTIRMKLDRLKKILDHLQHPKKLLKESQLRQKSKDSEIRRLQKKAELEAKVEKLTEMYLFYDQYGFKALVEKYDYRYTSANFVQQCKKYVKCFVSQNGKKRGKKMMERSDAGLYPVETQSGS